MEDEKLNNFSKKLFENLEFEKPPQDFTEKLMLKIEQANSVATIQTHSFFKNKFMFFFVFTFGIIIILSFIFSGNKETQETSKFAEKINSIDFSFLSKYFDIDFNFSFIAKLVVGSIVILIIVDILGGSLIDRIIDSRTKREDQA